MSAAEESPSRCSRKTALSLFFLLELIAYILSCVALISPSWQYVYLENGRTEHHHGLWLDCKRDYSHDYGRSREYYETLYRLDKQQAPLDQYFLTSLLCVYKFDYYIDTEDLYDHNHDENRLQDDANQHLPLGWKIASLAALGFAALTAGAALLLSVCAFCHRTLICAAAVLVTVAALLSTMGLLIFYIWANYQDNSIIKEEDGVYEQYFGWALYMQVAGTAMHFFASFMGCVVTSMAFRKSRAKLVKIEVVDGDDSTLLHRTTSPQFKRSFSAVYKLDSDALRKWEREYMNMVQSGSISGRDNFKRTTSVPNFKKYSRKNQYSPHEDKITKSTSNLFTSSDHCNFSTTSETFTSTAAKPWLQSSFPVPKSILKASSKQLSTMSNANQRLSDDPDLTYEYLPCDSVNKTQSTETMNKSFTTTFADTDLFDQNKGVRGQHTHPETSINVYDKVYDHIPDTTKPADYEHPLSYYKGTATSADKNLIYPEQQLANDKDVRSTLINDVSDNQPCSSSATTENLHAKSALAHEVPEKSSMPMEWRSSIDMRQNLAISSNDLFVTPRHDVDKMLVTAHTEMQPSSATSNLRSFAVDRKESSYFSSKHSSNLVPGDVAINTFDHGTFATREGKRSIKNLAFRPNRNENIEAFKRTDSSEYRSLDECITDNRKKPAPLMKPILPRSGGAQTTCDIISSPYIYLEDEMNRSVGSSATLENETVTEQNNSQQHEAQLCLNLFMNGMAPLVTGSRAGNDLSEAKKNNITTV